MLDKQWFKLSLHFVVFALLEIYNMCVCEFTAHEEAIPG